ncbi:DNA replication ATP-dependent helicase/nuclease JHS1 [Humulus lupulus]|uniref:DNA replication ATP-dependent helicase/nuclease JHS1 n=1 Tax=Humulus lupulus TaxID=3486 RepID=UPI002B40A866|nr:DNA replication ATP-dependent helicase/nuclease JHS1 [Humulus lupulus]
MRPRKKPNAAAASSSSKKSNQTNQSQQPSKFGIQHFFERHSQNALLASQNHPKNVPAEALAQNPIEVDDDDDNDHAAAASAFQNPTTRSKENGKGLANASQDKLPEKSENVEIEDSVLEVSPEISKSLKRFKFSPGMLIKQSQDDGGDEITWKISPVNDRLQAVSKRMPEMVRVLAESSRQNSLTIQQCTVNKTSPGASGKVEKWLSSPTPTVKALRRSLVSSNGLKRVNPEQDADFSRTTTNATSCKVASRQSPFRTPPSLPYCHDKHANDVAKNKAYDQLEQKQHKKALLELLDQVEDVISVEDSASDNADGFQCHVEDGNSDVIPVKVDLPDKGVRTHLLDLQEVPEPYSNCNFLVLEVSEKRGTINSSSAQLPYKVLRLLNEQNGVERIACLWEEWFYSVISPGDTVNIIGEFDDQGNCHVSREKNFLIVHPNLLLSGTRVAGSFNCARRTVLDERLRCNENSSAALIGTLLHQIFQAGLTKEMPTVIFLEEYARTLLQQNIENLYACGVNEKDIYRTLIEAIPKLLNWVKLFKYPQDSNTLVVNFGSDIGSKQVNISEVLDIEEMTWAPKYGLKGMIDASIRVEVGSNKNGRTENVMPLEFKSGKAPNGQSSTEHSAQVILYTLLMSERYQKHIDSGLLYYLQSDQTQGISVRRSDLIGLIMRRNDLATDILKALTTQVLPPMLQSLNMCKGCRHLYGCTIYHKVHGGSAESSGLGDLFDSNTHHLTTSHGSFLRHWDWLIDLEAKEIQLSKNKIWRSHSLRSDHARLFSIALHDELPHWEIKKDNRFIYRFVCHSVPSVDKKLSDGDSLNAPSSPTKDSRCTLKSGDYVILSAGSGHLTIASGVVTESSDWHVSVSLSKRLRLPGNASSEACDLAREVWWIDKDEFMSSFAIMRFNLVQLFLQSAQSTHLRKMIVDLEAPRFDSGCILSQDPAISYVWSQKNLNDDQRLAILKILTARDYALILGMPGTGKTSTMVHAVKALLIRGASILLTSYTNSAVDNLLIKLKTQGIDFLRIGRHEAVHEEVRGHSISAMNLQGVEDMKAKLEQVRVVAVTCLGITSPLLTNKRFDVCIMDEAGQTTLPVSLGPLMFASMFVLVGDHYQLPPLVQSVEARENGLGVSLFRRLSEAHPQAISALRSQYRMSRGIMDLSNALIYGDKLCCGSSDIANAKLKFSSLKFGSLWIQEILNPSRPVIFINTDTIPAYEAKDQKTINNPMEAQIVIEVTEELVKNGIEEEDIGIITPYNSQANIIRQTISLTSVEIHTIDKYQGRDKDCILVSFVRSSENPRNCSSSLLGDWHRINVALTRAKKKLIMVGSCKTLSKVPLLKLLIEKVEEQSGIVCAPKKGINCTRGLKRCSQSQLR